MGACACGAYAYWKLCISMSKNPLSFSTMQRYDIYKSTSESFRRCKEDSSNNGKNKGIFTNRQKSLSQNPNFLPLKH